MGRLLTPVDNLPQLPGHAHPDLAAFGQIPADHAVPVPVASPPPAGARVGEVRVHARLVAQARAAGEPGAVVVRDADARAGRQRREHRRLRPDTFPGGLAGHDPGHEEPGLPLDLGVQVASGADHAVGLPMAETAAVAGLRRTLGDGNPSGNRETRRPPAATPAPPPAAAWKAARPALTAMQHPPVHGPVFSRFGRHGRQDPFSSDGNYVLRLISLPTVEALRPGIRPIPRTPAPLPISIWMTRRSSSDRCEYTSPVGATSLRTGYPDNLQSNGCCTFIETTGVSILVLRASLLPQKASCSFWRLLRSEVITRDKTGTLTGELI